MRINKTDIALVLRRWYDSRLALVIEGVFIGLVAGLVVSLFRYLLGEADALRERLYAALPRLPFHWTLFWVLALAAAGLFMGWAAKVRPLIKGSGIPQVKGGLLGKLKPDWVAELPLKLLTGLLALGAGLSMGREGPSIQLGAYAGMAVLSVFRRHERKRNYLITAASSAGLAAAFNAPMAGLLFALEELRPSFSSVFIVCAMGAAMTANTVAGALLGPETVFDFHQVEALPLRDLPWVVLLGAVCALLGDLFKRSLYASQNLYGRLGIPQVVRPVLPLLASVPVGLFFADIAGGGHALIESLPQGGRALWLIALLLAGKLLFTALCYGSGAAGGIFLPLLTCGALTGQILGMVLSQTFAVSPDRVLNFMILGMAGFFAGTVQAPVTGTVLILEMCGNFNHLNSLVLVSFSAFVTAGLIGSRPVYKVLLERILGTAAGGAGSPSNSLK